MGKTKCVRVRFNVGGEEGKPTCSWRGRVCELRPHLAEACPCELVECPNAEVGCTEQVLRKFAARHASETCGYRKSTCKHCRSLFVARNLPEHEGSCPHALLKCPNAGCGVTVARSSMVEHRGACGREEVVCPCPGCEERMVRADVAQHVEASGAVHVQRAWAAAAEQGRMIAIQKKEIADLQVKVAEQAAETAGLQRRAEALTHVFSWSTDGSWRSAQSRSHTFVDGVRGNCANGTPPGSEIAHWITFELEEGPVCRMHYKCCILGKDDTVLRVSQRA